MDLKEYSARLVSRMDHFVRHYSRASLAAMYFYIHLESIKVYTINYVELEFHAIAHLTFDMVFYCWFCRTSLAFVELNLCKEIVCE